MAQADARRRRDALVLALSALAGALDAVSYLALGRVFTANMTGNAVLLGAAFVAGGASKTLRNVAAIGGFFAGALAGSRLVRNASDTQIWPSRATIAIVIESVVLAAAGLAWHHLQPGEAQVLPYVVAAGFVMGLQSAATQALAVKGVSSTYITGTLVLFAEAIAGRPHTADRPRAVLLALVWAVYIPGAVLGAAIATHLPRLILLIPAGCAAFIAAIAAIAFRRVQD